MSSRIDAPTPGIRASFAVLTPTNLGAIAIIQLWGPDALAVADAVFRPLKQGRLSRTRPGVLRLGRVGGGLGDEVVAVIRPRGPDTPDGAMGGSVELQCHGGIMACKLVTEQLSSAGAIRRGPDDWCREQVGSALRASAWEDLALARTVRVAEILLDQAQGAFEREIEALLTSLNQNSRESLVESARRIASLIGRAGVGVRLIRGWRLVLAGRPNVGKSSLMNAIAGFPRTIVDATPGTTRDVVMASLAIDGWPIELMDTAGLRGATEDLEGMGIERARRAYREADLFLPVLDRSQSLLGQDFELIRTGPGRCSPIVVNKSDLPPAWDLIDLGDAAPRAIVTSTRGEPGIGSLVSSLGRWIVPDPPAKGSAVPFRESHVESLEQSARALHTGDRAGAIGWLTRLLDDADSDEWWTVTGGIRR